MDLGIDNIRPVLRRCLVESDSVRGIQLATSLAWFWITRGTTEGVRWLDELLASGPGNPETLGWSYFIRGFLAVLQGNWEAARPALEKSMAAARGRPRGVESALPGIAAHRLSHRRPDRSVLPARRAWPPRGDRGPAENRRAAARGLGEDSNRCRRDRHAGHEPDHQPGSRDGGRRPRCIEVRGRA